MARSKSLEKGFGGLLAASQERDREREQSAPVSDDPTQAETGAPAGQGSAKPRRAKLKRNREEKRMLAARIPVSQFSAFERHLLNAGDYLPSKPTKERGLEALVLLLSTPEVFERWLGHLEAIPEPRD